MAQMLGAGRERIAQGSKQFMKSTPDLHDGANDQPAGVFNLMQIKLLFKTQNLIKTNFIRQFSFFLSLMMF